MKLYVTSETSQARKALESLRGRLAQYITSNLTHNGIIRYIKKKDKFYVKSGKESIEVDLAYVCLIVDNDIRVKIITSY